MEHVYLWLGEWLRQNGLWAACALVAAESMGLPCPLPLAFLAAFDVVLAGRIGYWPALGLLAAAQLAGAAVSYYAGRAGDNALTRRLSGSAKLQGAHERLRQWYERRGAITVFFGRLVGQLRPVTSLVAGLSGVTQPVFWAWTAAGSALYVTYYMWVVRFGWRLWEAYPTMRWPALAAVAALFLATIGIAAARRKRGERPSEQPETAEAQQVPPG